MTVRARGLARRRVRRLRRRPDAVARAGARGRRPGARRRRRDGPRRAAARRRRVRRDRARPRRRAARRARRARRARPALEVETVRADAAGFELPARFALIAVPMQTLQLLPGRRRPRAASSPPRGARSLPGGLAGRRDRRRARALRGARRRCPRPTSARPTGSSTSPSRSPCASGPARCGSSGSARSSRPTARRTSEDDVIELRTAQRRGPRRRGRAARPARRAAARGPAHARARRLHGGDAAWLIACCASARSIPT